MKACPAPAQQKSKNKWGKIFWTWPILNSFFQIFVSSFSTIDQSRLNKINSTGTYLGADRNGPVPTGTEKCLNHAKISGAEKSESSLDTVVDWMVVTVVISPALLLLLLVVAVMMVITGLLMLMKSAATMLLLLLLTANNPQSSHPP